MYSIHSYSASFFTNAHILLYTYIYTYIYSMFLKSYEGDIADLTLTFTISSDTSLGGHTEVELLPGGSRMPVTSANKHRYKYVSILV